MDIFGHFNNLTENKIEYDSGNDEVVKSYNSFMINRIASMTEAYILLANQINQFYDIPKETHYNYYFQMLPKRRHFAKYLKRAKEANKEEIDLICRYFEVGKRDAEEYFEMLTEKQMETLKEKYKFGKVK